MLIENGWSLVDHEPSKWDIGVAARASRRLKPLQAILDKGNFDIIAHLQVHFPRSACDCKVYPL